MQAIPQPDRDPLQRRLRQAPRPRSGSDGRAPRARRRAPPRHRRDASTRRSSGVGLAVDGDAHAEGMSVHPRIRMARRRRRQEMGGLEGELFIDAHGSRLGDFARRCQGAITAARAACGSAGSSAIWDGRGNSQSAARRLAGELRALRPSAAAGNGAKSSAFERARVERRLRIDELQLIARALHERQRRPSGSRRSSRSSAAPAACRWSRWRSRSRRACSAAISASSTCSIGSPPVSTTKGGVPELPRQAARQARGQRHPASANLPPPGPSVPTKSVSQKLQVAVCAILLAAGPEIAAGEAAEHGRPPGLRAFALQRVEDLLDRVHGRNLALHGFRRKAQVLLAATRSRVRR